jgi:hypothetical protein
LEVHDGGVGTETTVDRVLVVLQVVLDELRIIDSILWLAVGSHCERWKEVDWYGVLARLSGGTQIAAEAVTHYRGSSPDLIQGRSRQITAQLLERSEM